MLNLRRFFRETLSIAFFMGFVMAGWQTALAAQSMPRMLDTPVTWVHFVLYALGGFFLLSLALMLPGIITGIIYGFVKVDWERPGMRRFLLGSAIGTGLILIFVFFRPDLIFRYTAKLSGMKGLLIGGGLVGMAYIAGAAIATGLIQFLELRDSKGQWSMVVGFWLFMVSAPALLYSIWVSGLIGSPLNYVVAIVIAAAIFFLVNRLVPKIYTWLKTGTGIRWWVVSACIVALFFVTWPAPQATVRGEPVDGDHPSIVFVTVDTLRTDAIDCYPKDLCIRLGTPNIQRLADEGKVFDYAYASAPWTVPSVGSYLSGLYPTAHGARNSANMTLSPGATTLAEILKDAGYVTSGIVVNGLLPPGSGMDQGFDYYVEMTTEMRLSRKLLFQRMLDRIVLTWPEPTMPNDNPVMEVEAVRRAGEFIGEHKDERFFLWLHLYAPHSSYFPPKKYREIVKDEYGISVSRKNILVQKGMKDGQPAVNRERLEGVLALYAGEVRFADDSVGQVISTLDDEGIFDDCIFVFSSDHGEEFFEHEKMAHGHTLYSEVVHIPLIFRWPGRIEPGRVPERVSLVDLPPTILELAGVNAELDGEPAEFTGRSLASRITDDLAVAELPVYFEDPLRYDWEQQGIIHEDYLYIGGEDAVMPEKLYYMPDDHRLQYNLLRDYPERTELMRKMIRELTTGFEEIAERIGSSGYVDRDEELRALGYIN